MTDMVNHPAHYNRGVTTEVDCPECGHSWHRPIEAIEVIRHVRDSRLANVMRYVWRVAFGGKTDDRQDVGKAMFYVQDWLDFPIGDVPEPPIGPNPFVTPTGYKPGDVVERLTGVHVGWRRIDCDGDEWYHDGDRWWCISASSGRRILGALAAQYSGPYTCLSEIEVTE